MSQELENKIALLEAERNEADRRAGAAERQLAFANDKLASAQRWQQEAKAQAGFGYWDSFDEVWKKVLERSNYASTRPAEVRIKELEAKLARKEQPARSFERAFNNVLDAIQKLEISYYYNHRSDEVQANGFKNQHEVAALVLSKLGINKPREKP